MRRPRRVGKPFALLARRQLQDVLDRAWAPIHLRVEMPGGREALRHRRQREVARIDRIDLVPCERRRHARVGRGAHRVRGRDRPVLRVLVVVEEHAVPLLLPPLARRQRRRAALDLARDRERGAPHAIEGPRALDADVDVHAAGAGRLRPADQAEILERRLDHVRDLADLGPGDAGHRIEVDAQLVGMIEVVRADRVRMQLEAGQVCHPHERGGVARHDFFRRPARRKFQRDDLDPRRTRLGRALLVEELAVDAVRIPHEHVRAIARRV